MLRQSWVTRNEHRLKKSTFCCGTRPIMYTLCIRANLGNWSDVSMNIPDDYWRRTITALELSLLLINLDPDTKIFITDHDYDADIIHFKHLTKVGSNGDLFFGLSVDDYFERDDIMDDDDIWDDELEEEIEGELE